MLYILAAKIYFSPFLLLVTHAKQVRRHYYTLIQEILFLFSSTDGSGRTLRYSFRQSRKFPEL